MTALIEKDRTKNKNATKTPWPKINKTVIDILFYSFNHEKPTPSNPLPPLRKELQKRGVGRGIFGRGSEMILYLRIPLPIGKSASIDKEIPLLLTL